MVRSVIAGTGSYVPPKVVTNHDLSKLMDTSDEWIRTRSGIEERHFAEDGVSCSDLALEASKNALADAGMSPSEIDFILFATLSPDQNFPGGGCYLQAKLGIGPIGAMDIRNQCAGFLYALATADAFIRSGIYRKILVVGAEVHSSILDFTDRGRNMAVLFGDGAAAAVVTASEDSNRGILYSELHADGNYASCLQMKVWDISRKPYLSPETLTSAEIWPEMDGENGFQACCGAADRDRREQHQAQWRETRGYQVCYSSPGQSAHQHDGGGTAGISPGKIFEQHSEIREHQRGVHSSPPGPNPPFREAGTGGSPVTHGFRLGVYLGFDTPALVAAFRRQAPCRHRPNQQSGPQSSEGQPAIPAVPVPFTLNMPSDHTHQLSFHLLETGM